MSTKAADYLRLACEAKGLSVDNVLSHRLSEDAIIFVMEQGHKYIVPLAELDVAEREAKKVDTLKKTLTSSTRRQTRKAKTK